MLPRVEHRGIKVQGCVTFSKTLSDIYEGVVIMTEQLTSGKLEGQHTKLSNVRLFSQQADGYDVHIKFGGISGE